MQDTERLRTALRVLHAVGEYHAPEESDLQALRSYMPLFKHAPPDELACEVIRQILKARGRVSDVLTGTVNDQVGNV